MILVDTSVWIDYFNGIGNVYTDILDNALTDGTVACGDIIFLEILQGVGNDNEYRRLKSRLAALDQYELFGSDMVYRCADNYRALRKIGITVRKTNDVIIATYCITNNLPLLFTDRDFQPFVNHLGLQSAYSDT